MATHWISIHIFYNGNRNHMLTTCLEPLVQDLRKRNLVQHYFFIRYWQEGPHIRLRLLPAESVKAEAVTRRAEENISAYLQRRPALYNADNDYAKALYKDMFLT